VVLRNKHLLPPSSVSINCQPAGQGTSLRTVEYHPVAPCSSASRANTLRAVYFCFRGAVRSSTNIASLAALNGSSRGADRTHGFFGGGSASNNACRIVGRPTRWRHASSRINRSSRRASRRIANSNHNCVH
jgi:hypothetical protein